MTTEFALELARTSQPIIPNTQSNLQSLLNGSNNSSNSIAVEHKNGIWP